MGIQEKYRFAAPVLDRLVAQSRSLNTTKPIEVELAEPERYGEGGTMKGEISEEGLLPQDSISLPATATRLQLAQDRSASPTDSSTPNTTNLPTATSDASSLGESTGRTSQTTLSKSEPSLVSSQTFGISASNTPKTITMQPVADDISTASVQSLPSSIILASVGVATVTTATLSGNQELPVISDAPKVTAADAKNSTSAPLVDPTGLMPGKNQPKPAMDAAAAASFMIINGLVPVPTPRGSQIAFTTRSPFAAPISAARSQSVFSTSLTPSSRNFVASIVPSSSISTTSQTRFVTLTWGQQGKEQAPVTLESYQTSTAVPTTQSSRTIARSSSLVASTVTIQTPAAFSLAAANTFAREGGRLTPLARTLFIVFGVLGAIAILIAFGVIIMMRCSRKRRPARLTNQGDSSDNPFGSSWKGKEPQRTTYFSENRSVASMTESEKAIVMRAASPDGEPNPEMTNPGSRIADAINAFVAKSRRLTYKLSP
ncbi:hypothetical protein FB567DRAFT_634083 [Paraphoma chrysanthemicola]|uniref:Uncharacterized protein n=1 Tax=Paraphoma chrysanthemicola TaxID=798071 RepID=A0A8K0QUA1_9PLEO|nr:hypothetical protein FB567DRAFT_634083 [Paraphoma chrysanthemicola]